MRSALVLASFALTILAAPVPKAEGQAPARRHLTDNAAPIETFTDKQYQRTGDYRLVGSRGIQDGVDVEKRVNRLPGKARSEVESVDGDADVEKRVNRLPGKARSAAEGVDGDVDVEKRVNRLPGKARSEAESVDGDADVEKRVNRLPGKARSAAEDVDGDIDVEKRVNRLPGKARSEGVKNTIRNIYDGVVGIVEALKTRGFNSANSLPARQAM